MANERSGPPHANAHHSYCSARQPEPLSGACQPPHCVICIRKLTALLEDFADLDSCILVMRSESRLHRSITPPGLTTNKVYYGTNLATIKCCTMVFKASMTLVPVLALVSKKGTPNSSAHFCRTSDAMKSLNTMPAGNEDANAKVCTRTISNMN